MKTVASIMKQFISCVRLPGGCCETCELKIENYIRPFMVNNKPVDFVLPAFPAKSANRTKTLSELPDLGETLALEKLSRLIREIDAVHEPGARLTICADGHVFNDIVGVSDEAVLRYQQSLRRCCQALGLGKISFFELGHAYVDDNYVSIRQQLVEDFGKSIASIRQSIMANEDERLLFCGLHRFLYEDLSVLLAHRSKNQIKEEAKQRTYQTIQRSHAWSDLIAKQFPQAIRLSIHPHHCSSLKLSVKLIDSAGQWATPWHNVPLEINGQYQLVKRQKALDLGARLVMHPEPWQQHYVLDTLDKRQQVSNW